MNSITIASIAAEKTFLGRHEFGVSETVRRNACLINTPYGGGK